MTGFECHHTLDGRLRRGNGTELEEADERLRILLVGHEPAPQERADLGGPDQPLAVPVVVERLDPEAIPRQHESRTSRGGIEEGEGEHPAEPGDHLVSPSSIAPQDDLGVALGAKRRRRGGELPAKLDVIVDLAVVRDPEPAAHLPHGHAPARCQVENGQAARAEDRPVPHPVVVIGPDVIGVPRGDRKSSAQGQGAGKDEAPVVRAPVRLGVEHGQHGGHVLAARAAVPPHDPGEAAHRLALTPPGT